MTADAISGGSGRRLSRLSIAKREAITGYLFISPWLLGFVVFSLLPILGVLVLGLTRYDVLSSPRFIGIDNFVEMATTDRLFPKALGNTLFYVGIQVPIFVTLAFLLAMLLNAKVPGIGAFRSAIYLPSVVPIVGSAVVWAWILSPADGVLNLYLDVIGLRGHNWLGRAALAKPSLIFISLYHVGVLMVIFLAGLQNIPVHLYEAARIDGANSLQQFTNITIPMMTPTIFLNLVMQIINSFQVVTYALLMTQGGPINATLFYVLYIFRSAFEFFEMGYACALATILFLIMVVLTLPLFLSSDRWVQYEQI
jgi:multiple sugar transport system permease protein